MNSQFSYSVLMETLSFLTENTVEVILKEGSSEARCWPYILQGLGFPVLDLIMAQQTWVEQFLYLAKESRKGSKAN